MPNSLGYNTTKFTQESSATLSCSPRGSIIPDTRSDQFGYRSTSISPNLTLEQPHDHLLNQHGDASPNLNPNPAPDRNESLPDAPSSTQPRPPPHPPDLGSLSITPVLYRECLKNHAASAGGHVLDGCGEFMPCGEEGTPEAFKCAACHCHRSFHRKAAYGDPRTGTNHYSIRRPPPILPAIPPQHHNHQQHRYTHLTPKMVAFGGHSGAPAEFSSSEELNMFQSTAGIIQAAMQMQPSSFSISKKRFRTKFTQQQKDKMHEFAEKIGWRIQNQDEREVQQLCDEVGVKRQVFKVWMHNNKQALKKKQM